MPIISSTTRKDTYALKQLIHYIHAHEIAEEWSFTLLHNISTPALDKQAIIDTFKANDQYRKRRKGGVVMYHDIISFAPEDSPVLKSDPSILFDMARHYITRRAPYGMAVAKVHEDKAHLHIHVLLSAVEYKSSQSIRLSRKAFRELRREIERYQLEKYPELKYSYVHESVRKELDKDRNWTLKQEI